MLIRFPQALATAPKKDAESETITTIFNDTIIRHQGLVVHNGCFFISLAQATGSDPYQLLVDSQYEDWSEPIDDTKEEHRKCMERLATQLKINIEIYSGKQKGKASWLRRYPNVAGEVKCDPSVASATRLVRLITNGGHFELIPPVVNLEIKEEKKIQRVVRVVTPLRQIQSTAPPIPMEEELVEEEESDSSSASAEEDRPLARETTSGHRPWRSPCPIYLLRQ